jgi:hypothetical protein
MAGVEVVRGVELGLVPVSEPEPVPVMRGAKEVVKSDLESDVLVDIPVAGVVKLEGNLGVRCVQAPVIWVYAVVVSVVAVMSQPVCVEHVLVVLVMTVGLIEPTDPVIVDVMKSVLAVQSSTVVLDVQVVVSEEVASEEVVAVDEEEVFVSFPSSSSSSSSVSAPSVKSSKLFLNCSSSSSVISSGSGRSSLAGSSLTLSGPILH